MGLTVIKDEVPESNVKLHIAACLEVVRGKMGAEVDVMVYTNKELTSTEHTTVKDMVLTSWQGTSLFTSTPEIESRKLCDGGLVLKIPISKNCDILGDIETPEGVDPSFLAILPEQMRQEVIEEQRKLKHSRQQPLPKPAAAARISTDAMQEVNPEFLAALPPNIQEEVLAQQRMEQLRQRQATSNPTEADNTGEFFQTLPPSPRQSLLAEMEESQSIKEVNSDMPSEGKVARTIGQQEDISAKLEIAKTMKDLLPPGDKVPIASADQNANIIGYRDLQVF